MCIKVYLFHHAAMCCTFANKVTKVFESDFTFASSLQSILASCTELFDRALKSDTKIVCRETQDFADGA